MDVRTPIKSNWGYFGEKYGAAWEQLLASLANDFTSSIEQVLKPGVDPVDIPTVIVKKRSSSIFFAR